MIRILIICKFAELYALKSGFPTQQNQASGDISYHTDIGTAHQDIVILFYLLLIASSCPRPEQVG